MPLIHSAGKSRFWFLAVAIIGSLALSLWEVLLTPLVNNDGILYLIAAEKLLDSGVADSLTIYSWPFFHGAIAAIHHLGGLELLTSAQLLVALCFVLVVLAFYRLTRVLGGNHSVLWFGLAVVLCHGAFNDFRALLIRDPGMIAFLLLALAEHYRFEENGRWRHAVAWTLCVLVAFLFRVEALAIAMLGPLGTVFASARPLRSRLIMVGRFLVIPLGLMVACLALYPISPLHGGDNLKLISDLGFLQRGLQGLEASIRQYSAVIGEQVLGEFSRDDGAIAFFAVIVTITAMAILSAITPPYVIALAVSRFTRTPASLRGKTHLLWWYGLIVAGYLFVFALLARFSLPRYSMPLALLALLPLAFYLAAWWEGARRRQLVRSLIVLLLVANLADGLVSGDWRKSYLREATAWIRDSTLVPDYNLVTNEAHLSYFSGKSDLDGVLRTINPARQPLRERRDLFWLPGQVYAYRVQRGAEAQQLTEDIRRGEGRVLRRFQGRDDHALYLFTVTRDVERSPAFIDFP